MSAKWERLRPGDLVELRPPDEISRTLDGDAARDHLPFMPEMLEFYGRRFRVARRAITLCCYLPGRESRRGFQADNVVTLEGVRCSGGAHDGCPKACTIFWHEAWLKRADRDVAAPHVDLPGVEALRSRLKVSSGAATYFCQASELHKATHALSRWERVTRYVRGLRAGNFSILEMANSLAIYVLWTLRRKLFDVYPRGNCKVTPAETLKLQPGEWVEVKPLKSILKTLDDRGLNKGLWFSPDMRLWCGRKTRVKSRLDKIIVDGSGKVRKLKNTVLLEGSTCGCSYLALGMAGCSRCEFTYWREIWLRRCDAPDPAPAVGDAVIT
jgi:hypothetical protein